MKVQNFFTKTVVSAGIFLTLQGCGQPNQSTQTPSANETIFTEAASPESSALLADREETKKLRYVHVNLAALKRILTSGRQSVLSLNLFDDEKVDVMLEDIDVKSANNIVVEGRIVGDNTSEVSLVVNGDVLIGNVRRGDGDSAENFEIRSKGNGLHSIRVPQGDKEENCEEINEGPVAGETPTGDLAKSMSEDQVGVLSSPVVKVLGAYTPQARANQGGTSAIVALIQKGVADTNRALADSGSSLRVQLVGTMETKSSESSSISNDLSALRSKTDSRFNDVHSVRTRLGADQVSLVGSYRNYAVAAGIGYVRSSYSNAFTVTKAAYFGQYTFSHELGHNLGLNHEDGYVSSAGRFRTIIAYGNLPRIRRYSNPSLTYNGYRTGDTYHNEMKIINANAVRMSLLAN
jgi:hypothetical protein